MKSFLWFLVLHIETLHWQIKPVMHMLIIFKQQVYIYANFLNIYSPNLLHMILFYIQIINYNNVSYIPKLRGAKRVIIVIKLQLLFKTCVNTYVYTYVNICFVQCDRFWYSILKVSRVIHEIATVLIPEWYIHDLCAEDHFFRMLTPFSFIFFLCIYWQLLSKKQRELWCYCC